MTGDMDNNVHPAGTYRVIDALIRANKRFDFHLIPGKRHGYADASDWVFWIAGRLFQPAPAGFGVGQHRHAGTAAGGSYPPISKKTSGFVYEIRKRTPRSFNTFVRQPAAPSSRRPSQKN